MKVMPEIFKALYEKNIDVDILRMDRGLDIAALKIL